MQDTEAHRLHAIDQARHDFVIEFAAALDALRLAVAGDMVRLQALAHAIAKIVESPLDLPEFQLRSTDRPQTIGQEPGQLMEFSYYIKMKDEEKGNDLVADIRKVTGVEQVNLFFDEDEL